MAFSPDGKTILTGSGNATTWLWDGATGRPIGQPLRHQVPVQSVAFSPDGKTMLTGSLDHTARLWDTTSQEPVGQPMLHQGHVTSVAFSPDGRTILTGSDDKTARLWDAATQAPISRPMQHPSNVITVAFSPDGNAILTVSDDEMGRLWDAVTTQPIGPPLPLQGPVRFGDFSPDGKMIRIGGVYMARFWRLPPALYDDAPRIATWVETITGLTVDDQGSPRSLGYEEWQERRERLRALGGPPKSGLEWLFDPILYGADPAARAKAWVTRRQWDAAEAAFAEVLRAQPFSGAVWTDRGQFYLVRSQPEKAAAVFRDAVQLLPEDFSFRYHQIQAMLAAGDSNGLRQACSELLGRFHEMTEAGTANRVAWSCALAPGAVADRQAPVRLAEIALAGYPAGYKYLALNTLGAALYRAGRYDDAIHRLKEGIQLRDGTGVGPEVVFLAMSHHRLGQRAEARRWLDRLRNRHPSADPDQFWNELEIRLLRSEAEAVILYDPVFPADPFAH